MVPNVNVVVSKMRFILCLITFSWEFAVLE